MPLENVWAMWEGGSAGAPTPIPVCPRSAQKDVAVPLETAWAMWENRERIPLWMPWITSVVVSSILSRGWVARALFQRNSSCIAAPAVWCWPCRCPLVLRSLGCWAVLGRAWLVSFSV